MFVYPLSDTRTALSIWFQRKQIEAPVFDTTVSDRWGFGTVLTQSQQNRVLMGGVLKQVFWNSGGAQGLEPRTSCVRSRGSNSFRSMNDQAYNPRSFTADATRSSASM